MDKAEERLRRDCIWEAHKLVGTPYLWGSNHPDEGGLDCFAFILHCWRQVGVSIPDMTSNTGFEYLDEIDNPAPGDVAFYGHPTSRISHAMMLMSFNPKDLVCGASGGVSFRRVGIYKDSPCELTNEESSIYAQEMAERGAKVKYCDGHLYRADFRGFGRFPHEKGGIL